MARQGVWSVGTVAITGDEGEAGVAVLVVDEQEGGLIANDLWSELDEAEAVRTSLTQLFEELGRPRKIVVKAGALAKALRAAGVREDITVGAAPQLDAVLEALERDIAELANLPGPLDGEGATSAHLNALYVAADVLRQVAPWSFFPPATGFSVEAAALDIEEGGAFLVSGGDGLEDDEDLEDALDEDEDAEGYGDEAELGPGGWIFVESPEQFDAMAEALSEPTRDDARAVASAITLSYERAEELGPAFEAFAREHSLEVPADGWVPMLTRTERGVGLVPLRGSDYELATAICTAIANITVALAESEDEDEGICAQVVTQSGLEILIEGPMADEDDEGDEDDEALSH